MNRKKKRKCMNAQGMKKVAEASQGVSPGVRGKGKDRAGTQQLKSNVPGALLDSHLPSQFLRPVASRSIARRVGRSGTSSREQSARHRASHWQHMKWLMP